SYVRSLQRDEPNESQSRQRQRQRRLSILSRIEFSKLKRSFRRFDLPAELPGGRLPSDCNTLKETNTLKESATRCPSDSYTAPNALVPPAHNHHRRAEVAA